MFSLAQPPLQESNSFNAICWGVIILFIVLVVIATIQANANQKATKEKLEELKSVDNINIGKAITGLPVINESDLSISCAVTNEDFVFLRPNGEEAGRIPRDSINQILVEDKSQITQHITVGRVLALGVFALAAPKTRKQLNFYLLLDWNNESGDRENTVFEYSGTSSNIFANQAATALRKHVKPKVERLKADEKKCPFCAEIIKKEAKVCKHCGRDLP